MKKIIVAICLLTGFVIAVTPGIGFCYNIVYNGNFEKKGTDNLPEGWKVLVDRGTKATTGYDDTVKHGGNFSYKISIAPPGGRVVFYPDTKMLKPIKPGTKYQLSLWIKTARLDYNQFFVAPAARFNFLPARVSPAPTIDLMEAMKGVTGWKKLTVSATAPSGAKNITIDFIFTKGTVWLDDIDVEPVNN